jgi:hypothetical protein
LYSFGYDIGITATKDYAKSKEACSDFELTETQSIILEEVALV